MSPPERPPRSHSERPPSLGLLLVVAAVVLAGCAAAGVGAPAPYTERGADLNGTDLREAHSTGLREAGSFRAATALGLRSADATVRVNRTATIEATANRSSERIRIVGSLLDGNGVALETYTDGDRTYRRIEASVGNQEIRRYDAASAPYDDGPLGVRPANATRAAGLRLAERMADDANWTMEGVERYDGGWVTRYEASGAENFSSVRSAAVTAGMGDVEADGGAELPTGLDASIRSVNATLLIAPDGVVRYVRLHLVGAGDRPVELTLVLSIDAVGAATVEEPPWLDDARDVAGR